ncbi:hypothetical protein [Bombilactobacillus thymidiniphilus]|uniref:Uncharacterized protein n=1 Tax=Bombilactobacillus thymidiniphilus TaxID=2923363 RepID=A0ABY4PFD8_9LACO|nr:hypothetical protein [Bombilactobacillus thymidiniphilus]UQS84256.1 hypothetical protein MOO47_03655 [Bombilactobacillus thymidiniphilus]
MVQSEMTNYTNNLVSVSTSFVGVSMTLFTEIVQIRSWYLLRLTSTM